MSLKEKAKNGIVAYFQITRIIFLKADLWRIAASVILLKIWLGSSLIPNPLKESSTSCFYLDEEESKHCGDTDSSKGDK